MKECAPSQSYIFCPTKQKPDGKIKSKTDLWKYKDAIMWGATVAGEQLPSNFYSITDEFLGGYKKESRVKTSFQSEQLEIDREALRIVNEM